MKDRYDVVIIGAGMGGLTCGAWLAHKNMKVLVVEQNSQPGGCCSSYKRNSFHFTPAASIITGATKKDGVFERLLQTLRLDREITFIPLEQGYHVHLPDFDYYLYSGGEDARQRLIEQLIRIFPHEARGVQAFFNALVKIYRQMDYATFLGTRPADIARILLKCTTLVRHMGKGIMPFVNDFVTDPKLKTVLSINSTCCNLPPSRMSMLGIAGLLIEGGLSNPHVVGGSQAVAEVFAKSIQDHGGDILLGRLVKEIIVENNTACGVHVAESDFAAESVNREGVVEQKEFKAKYVVSNAAARQTFHELVGAEKLPAKFIKMLGTLEPTPPFCALFLGLDMDLKQMGFLPALHIHSSTYDIDEHFKNVNVKSTAEKFSADFFRFQLASLSDPNSAPKGKTAFVMHGIPAPADGWDDQDWQNRVTDTMIKRAETVIPGLSSRIHYQEFWSPATLNKYVMCGNDASIGWALTPQQVGPRRLAQQTPVNNLFLSGHWTAPAVGVMSTVVSGLQVAQTIMQHEGTPEPLADIGIRNGMLT